jgi:hypothetical protein
VDYDDAVHALCTPANQGMIKSTAKPYIVVGEQFLLVDRKTWPDFPQVVDRVDVWNDGVMAGALESLVMETAACALSDDRVIGHGDCAERLARLQAGDDLRNIRCQALREITHLGARIGDDLLALAIIEFLSDFQRLAGRPTEARAAQFLERRQIVELWRPLPLWTCPAFVESVFDFTLPAVRTEAG